MKAIYLNRDNRAQVFDVGVSKNIVEKHGYHPIPPNTVFRNAQNKDDAVCVIFQSRVVPYGDKQTSAFMELKQWEIYVTSLLDNKLDVDTEFSRMIKAFMKNAVPIGIMIFFLLIGLSALTQGDCLMKFLPHMNRKRWLSVMLLGLAFVISPFIFPDLITIILWFIGFPLMTTGFVMALLCVRHKFKKWEFRNVTALTINPDLTWSGFDYVPNITPESDVPEHVQPYMNDYRYIIPMKGWIPLTKYDVFTTKLKRNLKELLRPKKRGLLIFSYDNKGEDGSMAPVDHIHTYRGDFDLISPELYEKECKSTLAANFTKSQDSGKLKMNWIIIAIVVVVVLGILLKVTGAL